jgi:hypothetical protein
VQGLHGCAGRLHGGGARGQTAQDHTHDETHCEDQWDTTYGRHNMFSCPRYMEAQRCRSTPLHARPFVLYVGKKHAILSHTTSPECRLQRGDAIDTLLSRRGAVEAHARPLSF